MLMMIMLLSAALTYNVMIGSVNVFGVEMSKDFGFIMRVLNIKNFKMCVVYVV